VLGGDRVHAGVRKVGILQLWAGLGNDTHGAPVGGT
jgi:hypothetical protein